MNGTEKQIEWAESIINGEINKGKNNLIEAQARYERLKDQHPNEIKIWNARQAIEKLIADKLQTLTSASHIIDNRNDIRWVVFISGAKELSKDNQQIITELFPKIDDLNRWI